MLDMLEVFRNEVVFFDRGRYQSFVIISVCVRSRFSFVYQEVFIVCVSYFLSLGKIDVYFFFLRRNYEQFEVVGRCYFFFYDWFSCGYDLFLVMKF